MDWNNINSIRTEIEKQGMYIVPGFKYFYWPGKGISYDSRDHSPEAPSAIAHEVGHWQLGHTDAAGDPWLQFHQEVDAWDLALSKGFRPRKDFVRGRIEQYSKPVFDYMGNEKGKESLNDMERMLSKYY